MSTIAAPSKCLDLLTPTARPPTLDLGIRIVIKLDVVFRTVSPLVRITVRDRSAFKFGSHRCAHGIVACALIGSVG